MVRVVFILLTLLFVFPLDAAYMYRAVRQHTVRPGGRVWFWFPKGLHNGNPGQFTWQPPIAPAGFRHFHPFRTEDNTSWGQQWAGAFHVLDSTAPGTYDIDFRVLGEPPVQVTVLPALPVRPVFRATPQDSRQTLQAKLWAGYDVELTDGTYVWDAWVELPTGSKIFSSGGAKIVRHWDGDPASGALFKCVLLTLGEATIQGITFSHDDSLPDGFEACVFVFSRPEYVGNVTITDCTVERGSLSAISHTGCVIERCKFYRTGLGRVPPNGVVRDCEFVGRGATGQHALTNYSASDSLICSIRMENTTRGIIFQNHYARGCMVADIDLHNIRGGESFGANECLLLETPHGLPTPPVESMTDNAFLYIRATDCAGPGISMFGDGFRRNVFHSIDLHTDSIAVLLASLSPGGVIGPNNWSNIEVIGHLSIHGTLEAQSFENVAIVRPLTLRGNQGPFSEYYDFDLRWPTDTSLAAPATLDAAHAFSGCKVVTHEAVLPLQSIAPFRATTTDAADKTLIWWPLGYGPGQATRNEANYCEYLVVAHDASDLTRTATFSRKCKVSRVADGQPDLVDFQNDWSAGPEAWQCSTMIGGNSQFKIVVRGEAGKTIKWRLADVKWKRLF